jgi:hypothetical protein
MKNLNNSSYFRLLYIMGTLDKFSTLSSVNLPKITIILCMFLIAVFLFQISEVYAVYSPTMTTDSIQLNTSMANNTEALSPSYSNYTGDKYQIGFQYPSDWEFNEKTNRFEEGTDISIRSFDPPGFSLITVGRLDDLTSTSGSNDLITGFYDFYKQAISDYTKEISVIEQPSFINIDGQKAGTFLITQKDKYEDTALRLANQLWVVYVGDHGYLISFASPTDQFDSPKNAKIRDDFIKSIKFLGANNQTSTNTTNRFG